MSTPNFTSQEAIFSGINPLVPRGIDTSRPGSYNPRFAIFLAAINSSESLKAQVRAAAGMEIVFENSATLTEDAGSLDRRLQFDSTRKVISIGDDYFLWQREAQDGLDGFSTTRLQLGEQIRVISHEAGRSHLNSSERRTGGTGKTRGANCSPED